MDSFLELLSDQPVLLLFLVAAIGYPLGRIKVFGVSLGVSMVLFAALGVGAVSPSLRLPEVFSQIGLVLFVYTMGLANGAGFFAGLKKNGLPLAALVLGGLAFSSLLIWGFSHWLSLAPAQAAGGFTGALTNTAALAGVLHAVKDSDAGMPVVAYSIAYPMGVLGVILVQIGAWKWLKHDPERDGPRSAARLASRTLVVQNPQIAGMDIARIRADLGLKVLFGRRKRGGSLTLAEASTQLELGDEVTVVGDAEEVAKAQAAIGQFADGDLTQDRSHFDYRRIFVSNRKIVGIPLKALQIPSKLGAIITRVRRGDADFVPDGETILQQGDRVRVVADSDRLPEVSRFFGDSYKELSEIDVLSFSLGIALGTLLGLISLPLPGGIEVSLGLAGGPLLMSLILGALHRTGPIVWELPYSANLTLRQLGLILFFSGVGTRAGYTFWQTLWTPQGLMMFVAFGLVTVLTAAAFIVVSRKALRMSKAGLLGALAGFHTQPAALAFAGDHAKSDQPSLGYAAIFPIASLAKIICAQLLYSLLSL